MRVWGVLLCVMLASPVSAATLTYEFPFALSGHAVNPAFPFPEGPDIKGNYDIGANTLWAGWDVPAFDPSLGTPTSVSLELQAVLRIIVTTDADEIVLVASARDFSDQLVTPLAGVVDCPCTNQILETPVQLFGAELAPHLAFPVPIGLYPPNSFASYQVNFFSEFTSTFDGIARATYAYDPVSVPEPASLFLLVSGLALRRFVRV